MIKINSLTRTNGKQLYNMISFLKLAKEYSNQFNPRNHVLYINNAIWEKYKNELQPIVSNIEIIPTNFLPKEINAYYTKKLTSKQIRSFIEEKEKNKYGFKNIVKGKYKPNQNIKDDFNINMLSLSENETIDIMQQFRENLDSFNANFKMEKEEICKKNIGGTMQ